MPYDEFFQNLAQSTSRLRQHPLPPPGGPYASYFDPFWDGPPNEVGSTLVVILTLWPYPAVVSGPRFEITWRVQVTKPEVVAGMLDTLGISFGDDGSVIRAGGTHNLHFWFAADESAPEDSSRLAIVRTEWHPVDIIN